MIEGPTEPAGNGGSTDRGANADPDPVADADADAARPDRLRARLIRNLDEVPLQRERRAPLYDSMTARLAPGTAARQLGVSIDTLPPGMRSCPYHFHYAREEAFVVLEGAGTLRVAGARLPLRAGDVVFIPAGPEYPHQIINTSDAPLRHLSIGTQQSPEVVEYPDSGKFLTIAPRDGDPYGFDRMRRLTAGELDYWDGEP